MQAVLAEIPRDENSWSRWCFHHRTSHEAIIAKLRELGRPLTYYIVEPINWAQPELFLQSNSEMHIDMTAAVGLQSTNLQDVDLKDERQLIAWIFLHAQDHRNVESALGL